MNKAYLPPQLGAGGHDQQVEATARGNLVLRGPGSGVFRRLVRESLVAHASPPLSVFQLSVFSSLVGYRTFYRLKGRYVYGREGTNTDEQNPKKRSPTRFFRTSWDFLKFFWMGTWWRRGPPAMPECLSQPTEITRTTSRLMRTWCRRRYHLSTGIMFSIFPLAPLIFPSGLPGKIRCFRVEFYS